jgi:hypothetical protein
LISDDFPEHSHIRRRAKPDGILISGKCYWSPELNEFRREHGDLVTVRLDPETDQTVTIVVDGKECTLFLVPQGTRRHAMLAERRLEVAQTTIGTLPRGEDLPLAWYITAAMSVVVASPKHTSLGRVYRYLCDQAHREDRPPLPSYSTFVRHMRIVQKAPHLWGFTPFQTWQQLFARETPRPHVQRDGDVIIVREFAGFRGRDGHLPPQLQIWTKGQIERLMAERAREERAHRTVARKVADACDRQIARLRNRFSWRRVRQLIRAHA